ncbi:MAG TPA: hypothetical protein DEP69_05730 [Acidimicrobiaceae bacterium]|nr:hypothetical protein [Acidimicrobiaceae bacterium]
MSDVIDKTTDAAAVDAEFCEMTAIEWPERRGTAQPRPAAPPEQLARRERHIEAIQKAKEAAEAVGVMEPPPWMPSVLSRFDFWNTTPTRLEESDPFFVDRPSGQVIDRSFETLLHLLTMIPKMPKPQVGLDGDGGIEIGCYSDDRLLKACVAIEPDVDSIYAWGKLREDAESWEGTLDDSWDKIRHILELLAAE